MKILLPYSTMRRGALVLSFLLGLAGCSENLTPVDDQISTAKLMIVTTTTQVTDLVDQLVGDKCSVRPMMGQGVDPHLYKPTARDIMSLSTADLIVYHGLNLEGKLGSTFKKAGLSQPKTYAIHSAVDPKFLLASDEKKGHFDPHIWFDPGIWIQCLHGLSRRLCLLLPDDSALIEARAKKLSLQYQSIQQFATSAFAEIPPNQRKLITSHDAFRYFGEFFGFEVIALQGISTATEAGLGDRANLVDFIKSHQVPCIFVESSVNPKAIKEVAREAKTAIGKPLFSDALGAKTDTVRGPNEESHSLATWSGMMIYNTMAIVDGLARKKR
jgi:manganese/zinc/iron transport system substrate-binding protein